MAEDARELRLREVRLLSQLSAGLRDHVSPPDRWEARIVSYGEEDVRFEGEPPKPWRAIVVRFARRIGDHVLQGQQVVTLDLLEFGVLGAKDMGRYLAEKWQHEAADATEPEES